MSPISVLYFSTLKMNSHTFSSSPPRVACSIDLKMKMNFPTVSTPPRATSSTTGFTMKMTFQTMSTPPTVTSCSTGCVLCFINGKHALFSTHMANQQMQTGRNMEKFGIISQGLLKEFNEFYNFLIESLSAMYHATGCGSASPISKQRAYPPYGDIEEEEEELLKEYSIQELEAATDSWSHETEIGSGSTARIYRGHIGGGHRHVAIKAFKKNWWGKIKYQRALNLEYELLSKFRHKNIIRLLGSCLDQGCLIYEYLDCNLDDLFCRAIPWKIRLKIAHDVACGIMFLHDHGFVHRDIKPANVLLNNAYDAKICDFGFAIPVSDTPGLISGTLDYLDPIYTKTAIPGTYVDVYAFGRVLIQLITGDNFTMKRVTKENFARSMIDPKAADWPFPNAVSLVNLAFRCFTSDLADRPDLRGDILPELDRLMVPD
ncbi:Serine/threonine-protein kinase 38 [Orobanche hederae]